MVVVIRINDDNYATKDAFICNDIDSARKFIMEDAECEDETELKQFKVKKGLVMSPNCEVYDFEDGLVYRIHCKPTVIS